MASLKVYGKPYSANVTRVLTTLAEKNVDDYQLVPIDLLTGANKTPEYLKLQVLAASPASLFHLSSPLKHFQVYYSSSGVVLWFCSTRAMVIFVRKNHHELSWKLEDLTCKSDCSTVPERQVVIFSGRLDSVEPRAACASRSVVRALSFDDEWLRMLHFQVLCDHVVKLKKICLIPVLQPFGQIPAFQDGDFTLFGEQWFLFPVFGFHGKMYVVGCSAAAGKLDSSSIQFFFFFLWFLQFYVLMFCSSADVYYHRVACHCKIH